MNIGEINLFEFLHTGNALGHSLEIGKHTAQPALRNIRHCNARSLSCDSFGSLLLCAYEENGSVMSDSLLYEVVSLVDKLKRLEQIDDVNTVALRKNVLLHLRIPAAGLVSEVNTGLKHFAHCNLSHFMTFLSVIAWPCITERSRKTGRPTQYVADMARYVMRIGLIAISDTCNIIENH